MAQQQGVLEVRSLVVEIAPARRGAVSQQQRHTVGKALFHRGAQQIVEPRPFPKSSRQQQLEPSLVAQEMHVVERLLVIRISARIEQKLHERARLRMWRRRNRPRFPAANRTRDGGVWHLVHESVRAWICTSIEQ